MILVYARGEIFHAENAEHIFKTVWLGIEDAELVEVFLGNRNKDVARLEGVPHHVKFVG